MLALYEVYTFREANSIAEYGFDIMTTHVKMYPSLHEYDYVLNAFYYGHGSVLPNEYVVLL